MPQGRVGDQVLTRGIRVVWKYPWRKRKQRLEERQQPKISCEGRRCRFKAIKKKAAVSTSTKSKPGKKNTTKATPAKKPTVTKTKTGSTKATGNPGSLKRSERK